MEFTALVVPVPSVDWLVLDRRPPTDELSIPAHVTLLSPFVPPDEVSDGLVSELSSLFGDVVAFSFVLDEVCAFPDGTVYLAPEPSSPFRQLTHALARAFPEYPPYEGRFETVVPHVTVPLLDGETADDVERILTAHHEQQRTPRAYAQEAQLLLVGKNELRVLHEFPFGMAAA